MPNDPSEWSEYLATVEVINTGQISVGNLRLRGSVDLEGQRIYDHEVDVPVIPSGTRLIVALPGWRDYVGGPLQVKINLKGMIRFRVMDLGNVKYIVIVS